MKPMGISGTKNDQIECFEAIFSLMAQTTPAIQTVDKVSVSGDK